MEAVLTVREAIFAPAPTLERMRRRGFELAELTEKLHDQDLEISVPTLARYLNAWRRQKATKCFATPCKTKNKGGTVSPFPKQNC